MTINAPIGLNFRDEPGDIVNRSFAQNSAGEFVGLEVTSENSLALVGGNVNFEAGQATAKGGNIYLGGLASAGTVDLNLDGSLSFPDNLTLANISLTNGVDVDVRGTGGGNITVDAENLSLAAGEFGSSLIRAGITADSASESTQAGDIALDVAQNITIDDSSITNLVNFEGIGNAGNITIDTSSLELTNGGQVDASTFGQGNGGAINITATGDITIDGENSSGSNSNITSLVGISIEGGAFSTSTGDAGGVRISTTNLNLTNGGQVDASTFGQGNGGAINITATGDITIDGENGLSSGITSAVNLFGEGDAGGITISTTNLNLTNGGVVDAAAFSQGNGGAINITATGDITIDGEDSDGLTTSGITSAVTSAVNLFVVGDTEGDAGGITISTTNLNLTNGGVVDAAAFSQGNGGAINITATGDITIDGEDSDGLTSGITSQVNSDAEGDAGGVTISTSNLNLTNGGQVDASTLGRGNAGAVSVTATGDITADGEDLGGLPSGITSLVNSNAEGDAGGVTISTNNLNLTNGGRVDASTLGQGNAEAVTVTATGDITADGENSTGFQSGITSGVSSDAEGNAGGVTISTNNLNLTNGGRVDASTFGQGNAGAVSVTATGDITIDGEDSEGFPSGITSGVDSDAVGDAGGVTISTSNLNLTNGGQVLADTFGQGNAGAVSVTATGDITADGENSTGFQSGITSGVSSDAVGDAGGVTISTTNLNLTNGGIVDASTFGQGNAGAVSVTATGDITADGENSGGFPSGITSLVDTNAVGNAGGVTISTTNLNLTNGGRVDASTFGQGNAEAVTVTATGDITADGEDSEGFPSGITSGVDSDAVGDAGGVTISTTNLNLTNGGIVDASTFGQGNAGIVTIKATESIAIDGFIDRFRSGISANALNQDGNGGNVSINTGSLTIKDGGTIEATNFDNIGTQTSGTGLPGNLAITANSIDLTDNARIEAATQSTVGESAEIDLNIAEDITLRENSFISAQAFNSANGGNLNIDSRFIIAFPDGNNDIIANAQQGQGGNIIINAESLLGIQERRLLNDSTNDINASSQFSLDGTVTINTPDINPAQGATELPRNIIETGETTTQACRAHREAQAKNGLTISGKGGIVPDPASPLNSLNATINGENIPTSAIPAPIETSLGKIQPARGIKVTPSGKVILTAYRTNNSGDKPNGIAPQRIPEKRNCS